MITRRIHPAISRVGTALGALLVLGVATPGVRAAAQGTLPYDHTTFLHGIGSSDAIWRAPYSDLGGQTAPQYLNSQVYLKTFGAPYLNAGADGPPDNTPGLRYAGQVNNLTQFLTGAGGQHVLVAHSLGSLVARGAHRAFDGGSQPITGILTIAAPHQGARIADSAGYAVQYTQNLERALQDVQSGVGGIGDFLQAFGAVTLNPVALIVGHQYTQLAKGGVEFPTAGVEQLAGLEALKDLGPEKQVILDLNSYHGDAAIPHANIKGSIPIGHALLRLAAASGASSFDELKKRKDKGLSSLRKCSNFGFFTFNLLAPGSKCARAAALLGGLDERWAAYVNGTQYGLKSWMGYGQVARHVPFDGVVPNERSNYPTPQNLVFDRTVDGTNHQDIYKRKDGLDVAAAGMKQMGMVPAAALATTINGPAEFAGPQHLTWQAAPTGGDGSYTYDWAYIGDDGTFNALGGASSVSLDLYGSEQGFTLRVDVYSAGQRQTTSLHVSNARGGGDGCVPSPPQVECTARVVRPAPNSSRVHTGAGAATVQRSRVRP